MWDVVFFISIAIIIGRQVLVPFTNKKTEAQKLNS